jgi:DNA-binding transcriptional ArsR family regulator
MANQKVRRPETTPGVPRAEPTRPQLASAAATFTLLSNPTRLHVLWLAAQDVHDVTTLAERTGVGVATMSQHLSKLRLAGLISARQEGRRHVYTVEDPHAEGATAVEIAERAAIPARSANRVLRDKLLPNGLVTEAGVRSTRGRPSVVYQLADAALDEIAESFGVLDWHERTADRYERERGGYRELQRQREQRDREKHEAEWKPAEDGWWIPDPFAVPTRA